MINIAKKYLGINKSQRLDLMTYYNKYCYTLVDANRKYRIQSNDEWCSMFTSVIAHMAGYKKSEFPFEVSVFYQCQIAKKNGTYFTDVDRAEPNDLIIYDWKANGTYDHVGFVVKIEGDNLTAIEGNKDNTVAYRVINKRSNLIKGFISTSHITPESKLPTVITTPNATERYRIALLAIEVLKGKHGDGAARRHSLGVDYYMVQALINS